MTILTLLITLLAVAHHYWLEIPASGKVGEETAIQLFFGEYGHGIREKADKHLETMRLFKVSVISDKNEIISLDANKVADCCFSAQFKPAKAGFYQILAVNDTREVQDWSKHGLGIVRPIEYMRTSYVAFDKKYEGAQQLSLSPKTYIDIVPRYPKNEKGLYTNTFDTGEKVVLTAFKEGKPWAKTPVSITNPKGWKKMVYTEADGQITFMPDGKGTYLVELDFRDATPGNYKGAAYEKVRHKFCLTLHLAETEKKLSKL